MKSELAITMLLASGCTSAMKSPYPIQEDPRIDVLEKRFIQMELELAELQGAFFGIDKNGKIVTSGPGIPGYGLDGSQKGIDALGEVRELRERVWPLYSQGADKNKDMIDCIGKVCQ